MYIIFGESAANAVRETNVVLEVDTIKLLPRNLTVKSYCVLEPDNIGTVTEIDNNTKIHNDLIQQYRAQNWKYCLQAIQGLLGAWGGQLDEFYHSLHQRVLQFAANPIENWDYAVVKEVEIS